MRIGKEPFCRYIYSMKLSFRPKATITSFYILRAHIGPFVFSLATIMFLFLLQFIMKFADQLVGKGLSAWVIMELIAMNLAWMVVLAVPMSVLVATLMAFGNLSARNEITAMKASGMSIYRKMAPPFLAGIILALLMVEFNNNVLPDANHNAKTLTMDIRRKKPTLTLVAGLFSQDIPGYSILVRRTFERSNDLEGITLYDHTNPATNVVVTAERGSISFSPDFRKLIMDLEHGEIHELELQRMSSYRRIRFETHRIAMDVQGFDFERTEEGKFSRGDRELSAQAMLAIVDSLRATKHEFEGKLHGLVEQEMERVLTAVTLQQPQHASDESVQGRMRPAQAFRQFPHPQPRDAVDRARVMTSLVTNELIRIEAIQTQINQYMVEVHKKYAIPAACIVFVLIGAPLGIMARRGSFGMAATLSLGFFVLYWAFLIGGEKLGDRGLIPPFWAAWAANVLLGIVGAYLTVKIGREMVFVQWRPQQLLPKRWRERFQAEQALAAET
jgi:lipopolysaccharide export system permease protein